MKPVLAVLALATAATLGVAGAGSSPAKAAARGLDFYFIDVEGGAATLTVTPAGESILVDCGWPKQGGRDPKRIESVVRYVAGLDHIDHLVTTHWHTDHYGGVADLAKLVPIRNYWDRGIPEKATDGARDFDELIAAYKQATGGKSRTLKPGDQIPLRQVAGTPVRLKIVSGQGKVIGEGKKALPATCGRHGESPSPDDSDNALSLGMVISQGKFGFLNLGDLTWPMEHKLACPKNRVGQVDLWQVTHHGWQASGNPALVEATKPVVAVMTNGARKGASPSVVRMVKSAPSVQALYQVHYAAGNSAEDNTSRERIANLEEKCQGEFLKVSVAPDGSSYTVYKGAGQALETFRTR